MERFLGTTVVEDEAAFFAVPRIPQAVEVEPAPGTVGDGFDHEVAVEFRCSPSVRTNASRRI